MGQANHLGANVYSAVAGCGGEAFLEQAQSEAARSASELEDGFRGRELPVQHDQPGGLVLVEALRVLKRADAVIRSPSLLMGKRAQV